MNTWEIILEFLRVLTSTQIVIGLIALVFFCLFRQEIKELISRLGSIKFPGGEISTQSQKINVEAEPPKATPELPAGSQATIPQGLSLTPDQIDKLRQFIDAERANAYLWEYRYLNYFLVPHTQRVLDWFGQLPQSASMNLYDSAWQPLIPGAEERRAVINALQQHHLIQLTGGQLIEITPKGREYLQWRGPLPAAS